MSGVIKMLSPAEVLARYEDKSGTEALILDVRTETEWEEGHIPGSTLMPVHSLAFGHKELDKDRETIVVCQHGIRSLNAAKFLAATAGFSNVASMNGGLAAWSGPLESGE
jgi:rhodanese-related sulfurtransferase